jgi:hypothetical protein
MNASADLGRGLEGAKDAPVESPTRLDPRRGVDLPKLALDVGAPRPIPRAVVTVSETEHDQRINAGRLGNRGRRLTGSLQGAREDGIHIHAHEQLAQPLGFSTALSVQRRVRMAAQAAENVQLRAPVSNEICDTSTHGGGSINPSGCDRSHQPSRAVPASSIAVNKPT